MKRLISFLTLIFIAACTNAQNNGIENLPNYHILNADSVKLTSANLKKNEPVMFIYFSPDCPHCQHLVMEMKPYMKNLKNVQVVMITFVTQLRSLKDFNRNFGLAAYPNFTVGTEGYTYQMQQYFHVKQTPYVALYDKKGKLYKAWEHSPSMTELMAAVKKV